MATALTRLAPPLPSHEMLEQPIFRFASPQHYWLEVDAEASADDVVIS
jgi:hypothetical protein